MDFLTPGIKYHHDNTQQMHYIYIIHCGKCIAKHPSSFINQVNNAKCMVKYNYI